jgi:hypothetical protein
MMALNWNCAWSGTGKDDVGLSRWLWRVSHLMPNSTEFDSTIDSAWFNMCEGSQDLLVGERHTAYVRWRYAMRPGHESVFLQLRRPWQKKVVGVAVLSQFSIGQTCMHWLDWIGSPDLIAVACAMCRAEASRNGAAGLTAWASNAVHAKLMQTGISSQSEVAGIGVPTASALAPNEISHLNWWFMGGDSDFL